jgi:hypothetical protein
MKKENIFKVLKSFIKSKLNRIEVFKTDIQNKLQSEEVKNQILIQYPNVSIGFDLEDIDNVLRIEGLFFNKNKIIEILISKKINCEVMI